MLDVYITAQIKDKVTKQPENIPFYSKFWEYKTINLCWCCGTQPTNSGICSYCARQFPVKRKKND